MGVGGGEKLGRQDSVGRSEGVESKKISLGRWGQKKIGNGSRAPFPGSPKVPAGWELTLVQGRRHAALHPRGVVIHNVDGDVGVPVGDHLHRSIVFSSLRGDEGGTWKCPMGIRGIPGQSW